VSFASPRRTWSNLEEAPVRVRRNCSRLSPTRSAVTALAGLSAKGFCKQGGIRGIGGELGHGAVQRLGHLTGIADGARAAARSVSRRPSQAKAVVSEGPSVGASRTPGWPRVPRLCRAR